MKYRVVPRIAALVGILVLVGSAMVGCQRGSPGPPTAGPATVTVAQPLKKQIVEWDAYTGRLEPIQFVEIRARVSGYLQSIHFTEGDLVESGDLLFVIDPRPFEAALAQAKAALDKANAQRTQAAAGLAQAEAELEKMTANQTLTERVYARARRLREQNATPQEEVDITEGEYLQAKADVEGARAGIADANAAIASADAEFETARAALQAAQLDLNYTEIHAPIAGRISDHRVTIGNLISGGSSLSTLLTTITSLDPIHCTFDASEAEVLKYVRLSQSGARQSSREIKNPVYLALADEDGFPHVGHMDFVDNRFDPQSATMRAKAIFPNANNDLIPGLFASIRIPGSGSYEAVLVPDRSIGTDQATQYVLAVDQNKQVTRINIETGPIVDGLRVIRRGLIGDETIIISGLQRARPGVEVATQVETLAAEDDGLPDSYEPVPPDKWLSAARQTMTTGSDAGDREQSE